MKTPLFWLFTILALTGDSPATGAEKSPRATVDWFASVEAAVPGKPFDLAIRFRMGEGWHIYWQNPGDAGLPPKVTWNLPPGFTVGELQFPVPKRHAAPGNIVTNILEDEAVLLATVTPPDSAEPGRVTLTADVVYFVCQDVCVRETTKLQMELPVRPKGTEPAPANEEVFVAARRALPGKTSKYVSIKPVVSTSEFTPGKSFDFVLTVDVAPGFHIQSHEPLQASLVKADLFLDRIPGLSLQEPVFPPGQRRPVKVLGQISEYAGQIAIRVPGKVDDEAPATPPRFGGVFTFQACNEQGNCFPPDALAFLLPPGEKAGGQQTGSVTDIQPSAPAATTAEEVGEGGLDTFLRRLGLFGQLLACFIYGLFINATPCVLPLLSVKVLGFVQQAHESRRKTAMLGLAFGAGVVLFFVVLGLLATAGTNVLQYPAANIALGSVVLAMALAMLGVFTLQMPTAAATLEAKINQEGIASSFGKGALAPVLGFACTGPLLAGAFGWATQQPKHIAILAFLAAGLGMASPYMLLGANPRWLSFLPRPGKWMITFERIMGFLLLAMVVWLVNPLVTQIGAAGLQWTLIFFVAVGMACWVWGRVELTMPAAQRFRLRGAAAAIVVLGGLLIYGWVYPLSAAVTRQQVALAGNAEESHEGENGIAWRRWSPEAVRQEVEAGAIVFVDFTAAYCTICKVNKKIAINTPEFRQKLEELKAVTFQGDFSLPDKRIDAELKKHNRPGVPLNLIYPAGKPDEPILLPTQLTKQLLLDKLDEAARTTRATN